MRCAFTGCVLIFLPGLPIGGRELQGLPRAEVTHIMDAVIPAFCQQPCTRGGAHNERHLPGSTPILTLPGSTPTWRTPGLPWSTRTS